MPPCARRINPRCFAAAPAPMVMFPSLRINGQTVTPATLAAWRQGRTGIEAETADFLAEWWADSPTVVLHSSGSTGRPKRFDAPKEFLAASARTSLAAFGLQEACRALLCLPLRYIAGKMMVVRALIGGWELVTAEPSASPLPADDCFDFAALIPLQAARTPEQESLERIGTLLLGGGFIDPALEARLHRLTRCRVFASYGMTETYSHIALRRLNGAETSAAYTPLPGVQVSLSAAGTLCISAHHLGISRMETNDRAELCADGSFRILGRRDAVINSGGIKIQAEDIERTLAAHGITALALPAPHAELGECVALLWEGNADETALQAALAALPRYHRPKQSFRVDALPRTATGKISRAAGKELMRALHA